MNSSKLRYSFNSFDRNNDLLEKNEQNILLYWKYYLETFSPKPDHKSNEQNTLNNRLLRRCRWHSDTDFLSDPEILFLLISFPVVYYKKDLPGIMNSQIVNSYDPTTMRYKIGREIYGGYFHTLYEEKNDASSNDSIDNEIRESMFVRYGIDDKDIEWIELNIIQVHNWYSTNLQREGKSVISPQKNRPKVWLNFISTIFKEMQPEDFWYICCLQNLDLRKTEANNDLHAMLKKIVILLSPDFSFFEQIINGLDKFEEVQIDKGEILYSTDVTYQEIIFKNRIYKFGYKQGQVIRLLHECFLGEKSESLSWEDDIKSHPSVQCERKSLSQLFQDRASYYKEVIQPLPKGRYALNTQ